MRLTSLFCVLLCTNSPGQDVTPEQLSKLKDVQSSLNTVRHLKDRNLTVEQAEDHYLSMASRIVGYNVSAEEVPNLLREKETFTQQVKGFFTFTNVCWVAAGIMLAAAVVWLAGFYLMAILTMIPMWMYEILSYSAVGLAFYSGNLWFMFPSCFLLIACLYLTKFLHLSDRPFSKNVIANFDNDKVKINNFAFSYANLVSLVCTAVWGAVAYHYGSPLIGFLTVVALFSFLGFSVMVLPLCYCFGYNGKEKVARTTAASFLLLAIYVVYTISTQAKLVLPEMARMYDVFGHGILFVGTFVYFCSLLIISSKYYMPADDGRYWSSQVLTIISGVAALYVGSVYNIGLLQGIGGTFFFMYLLEKYSEIPWVRVGWAWSLLGLSGALYWAAGFAAQNPQYFIFGGK